MRTRKKKLKTCQLKSLFSIPTSIISYSILNIYQMSEVAVNYDSKTKKLSLPKGTEFGPDLSALKLEIDQLNTLTQEIISQGSDVPPAPTPDNFNKDLSKMIKNV